MGFLKPDGHEGSEQAESLARIEAGGIPLRAAQRKRSLATESSLFTSGLSVNEFALLDRMGPQPLAQVMGASVVQTGYQYLPALEPGVMVNTGSTYSSTTMNGPWQSPYTEPSFGQLRSYRWRATVVCELDVLTDAWNMARRRALDRLREEALQVGADAVVGVELHRGVQDFGKGTLEFAVRGTAIRLPGAPENAWPLLTDLSVQDYFKLHKAGYEPAGLLATTAVVFASAPRVVRLQRVRTKPRNQELDELSQAFRLARETVRARLLGQVSDAHGAGAVGVDFSHAVRRETFAIASSLQASMPRGWHTGRLGIPYFVSGEGDAKRPGWMITMHAAGTAIRRRPGPRDKPVPTSMQIGVT